MTALLRLGLAVGSLLLASIAATPASHAGEPALQRLAQAQPPLTEEEKARRKALEQQKALQQQKALEQQKALQQQKALEQQKALQQQKAQEQQRALQQQKALEQQRALQQQKALEQQRALQQQKALEQQKAVQQQKALEQQRALQEQKALQQQKALNKGPVQPGGPPLKQTPSTTGTANLPGTPGPADHTKQGPVYHAPGQGQTAPLTNQGPAASTSPGQTPQGILPKGPAGQIATPTPVLPGQQPKTPYAAPTITPNPNLTAGAPMRFQEVQKGRQQHVEDNGKRVVIQEPGNRIIVRQDNRIFIRHDEGERFQRLGRELHSEHRRDGIVETFYVRPDGFRVITETGPDGRVLRRYRRGPDGREYVLFDNRRFLATGLAIGIGAVALAVALNLPPPHVTIPPERYIVDYERASDDDIYEALAAPPVETLERAYSLDEIRDSYALRQRMRRVDLDTVTFDSGAWVITPDQYPKLERLAYVLRRILERDPDAVFMIEGHTDAVGNDVDNLSLSDRRAEAVAEALTNGFGIPPENLVTQGYGAQFLKIETPGPERLNRRVAVINITRLLAAR